MAIRNYRALCDVYIKTSVKGENEYHKAGDTIKFDDTNLGDIQTMRRGVRYKTIISNTDYARSFKDARAALAKKREKEAADVIVGNGEE